MIGLIAGLALLTTPPPPQPAEWAGRVTRRALDAVQEASGVPGLSFAIAWQDGGMASLTTGFADIDTGRLVGPATQFRLASVSKLYLATLAARLDAAGRFDLDARAGRYLPELPAGLAAVTGRQLAAHIAGLGHYTERDVWPHLYAQTYADAREAVSIFAARPLLAEPGEAYVYSSFGYTLLTAMVEAATGRTYPDLLDEEILHPTGLVETGPDWLHSRPADFTRLYNLQAATVSAAPRRDYSYSWGGAGMRASARDVATFGLLHLDPNWLDPEVWARMRAPARLLDGHPVGDRNYQVGIGWRSMAGPLGRPLAFHTGAIVGGRSALLVYPEDGLGVALLANSAWISQIDRTAALLAAPFLVEDPLDDQADCARLSRDMTGAFQNEPVRAHLEMRWQDGLCVGELEIDGALADWLGRYQPAIDRLALIGLSSGEDGRRLLAATPIGLADLLLVVQDGQLVLETEWGARHLRLEAAY